MTNVRAAGGVALTSGRTEGVMTVNDPRPNRPDSRLQFLRDLIEENASIAGDVVQVGEDLWAIHGLIPVDGDVLMAEFDSYDQATSVLDKLPRLAGRGGES
jgi:hypothetical protein